MFHWLNKVGFVLRRGDGWTTEDRGLFVDRCVRSVDRRLFERIPVIGAGFYCFFFCRRIAPISLTLRMFKAIFTRPSLLLKDSLTVVHLSIPGFSWDLKLKNWACKLILLTF